MWRATGGAQATTGQRACHTAAQLQLTVPPCGGSGFCFVRVASRTFAVHVVMHGSKCPAGGHEAPACRGWQPFTVEAAVLVQRDDGS
jgi:hypothetical protein